MNDRNFNLLLERDPPPAQFATQTGFVNRLQQTWPQSDMDPKRSVHNFPRHLVNPPRYWFHTTTNLPTFSLFQNQAKLGFLLICLSLVPWW